jgi:hypothetical protein
MTTESFWAKLRRGHLLAWGIAVVLISLIITAISFLTRA